MSMGADSTELFWIEDGHIVRESINGTDTMDLENSRKLRFITGLRYEDVLVSVHSSSRGTANTVSAALGLRELFENSKTCSGPHDVFIETDFHVTNRKNMFVP